MKLALGFRGFFFWETMVKFECALSLSQTFSLVEC
jgi:hypothetical protein